MFKHKKMGDDNAHAVRMSMTLDARVRREMEWLSDKWGMSLSHVMRQAIYDIAREERRKDELVQLRKEVTQDVMRLHTQGQAVPHKDA